MENKELPQGFEWCRKSKYEVQIELACYPLTNELTLQEGFIEKEFEENGVKTKYAVKEGFNILEQNSWVTSPQRPYVITGTAGERWPVKLSNLSAYDVDPSTIRIEPITVSTKDPSEQEFLVALNIPETTTAEVIPSWAFKDNGTIDETQIMIANSPSSMISHNQGDFIIAKHIEGQPDYLELPEEIRNTKESAILYDPRVINGLIMAKTYDHAQTQEEIKDKYKHLSLYINGV